MAMAALARDPRCRLLMFGLIIGPALALGGTSPWVVPPFGALVAALVAAHARHRQPLRVPWIAVVGLCAAGFTLLQVLPIPGIRSLLAPQLAAWIAHAHAGPGGWGGLSPAAADTALEVVRLAGLSGLALAAAQVSWRVSAAAVAVAGTAVAVVGLMQYGLGVDRIYGIHAAQHGDLSQSTAMLSTFVSPNHQSGLLLLGLMSTAGLWVDERREPAEARRLDRRVALGTALVLQLAALVLSMSRAALVVALVVAPLVAGLAWWPERGAGRAGPWRMVPRVAGAAVLVGVALGLGSLGAWHELQTLGMAEGIDPSTAARLRVTLASVDLVELAPLTGIGRGAYGDVLPAFDPAPTHVWYSHLECAPLTLVVEWGVVVGGALALVLPAWWLGAMRRAGRHDDGRARQVVLLGLLAVALQGLADFSLEFLGVGAPAAALAGALSPRAGWSLGPRRVRLAAVIGAGLAVASVGLVPGTWVHRGQPGPGSAEHALAQRPLDASRHRRVARQAAVAGDWAGALERARVAVRLEPGHVDGWLLLAAAARARGDRPAQHHATAEALARLHRPPERALVDHLVAGYPSPRALARLAPSDPVAWERMVRALVPVAPAHADALAEVWARRHPGSTVALQMRVEATLRLERPGLALHHARLWRQLDPADVHAHLAVARALQVAPKPRPGDVRDTLTRALAEARVDDPHLRGLVEEQLLRALLRMRGPAARLEARAVARALRTRPAPPAIRKRWRALFGPVLEG